MIVVTNSSLDQDIDLMGTWRASGKLTITGLSEGANTIPHGVGFTPESITLRPGAAGLWGETSIPDRTNLYITVGVGGATSGIVQYEGRPGN